MKKKWVGIAVIILICIGGVYWMLKPTEEEKILAENKKFTSQFISDMPEEKNFKQFSSKTGKYSMLYPNEFYMSDIFYHYDNNYETWIADQSNEIENKVVSSKEIQLMYGEIENRDVEGYLALTLDDVSYQGQHAKMTVDNKTIYYGQSHFAENGKKVEILDPKKYEPNHFFAFIVDNDTQQYVEIVYSLYCFDEEACNINVKEEQKFFAKMYKSVQFK